ncbi:MAG: hypothetical protein ACXWLS_12285 [Myxococcaceae bacterium]
MSASSRRSLLAAVLLASCSADPLNVIVLNARAPTDKCDFSDATLFVEGGSLDFRPWVDESGNVGQSTYFGQAFSWENQMLPAPITVNGQVVDPGGGNDFVADTIVYSYQYSNASVVLGSETQNIRAVISAGGTAEKNYMGAQLIQPLAANALSASLTPAGQTLLVTFQVFGKTGAGVGKYTNKVSFPLAVYQSGTTPLFCDPAPTDGGVPTHLFKGACNEPGRDVPVQCVPN